MAGNVGEEEDGVYAIKLEPPWCDKRSKQKKPRQLLNGLSPNERNPTVNWGE